MSIMAEMEPRSLAIMSRTLAISSGLHLGNSKSSPISLSFGSNSLRRKGCVGGSLMGFDLVILKAVSTASSRLSGAHSITSETTLSGNMSLRVLAMSSAIGRYDFCVKWHVSLVAAVSFGENGWAITTFVYDSVGKNRFSAS